MVFDGNWKYFNEEGDRSKGIRRGISESCSLHRSTRGGMRLRSERVVRSSSIYFSGARALLDSTKAWQVPLVHLGKDMAGYQPTQAEKVRSIARLTAIMY